MKIAISSRAKAEIADIRRYIAKDNPIAAKREQERIKDAIRLLASGGMDGREVLMDDGRSARTWLVSSYTVYYRRMNNTLQILRVYHQSRRPIER